MNSLFIFAGLNYYLCNLHASPTEHQATPNKDKKFDKNFKGWHQHRADIEHKFNKGG